MSFRQFYRKNRLSRKHTILVLSCLPVFIHTIQHLFAQSFFPFLILMLLAVLFAFLWSIKAVKVQTILKLWGILLLGYGLMRFALVALVFIAESGVPSDIYYQLDAWYFIISIFTVSVGIWIINNRKTGFAI